MTVGTQVWSCLRRGRLVAFFRRRAVSPLHLSLVVIAPAQPSPCVPVMALTSGRQRFILPRPARRQHNMSLMQTVVRASAQRSPDRWELSLLFLGVGVGFSVSITRRSTRTKGVSVVLRGVVVESLLRLGAGVALRRLTWSLDGFKRT